MTPTNFDDPNAFKDLDDFGHTVEPCSCCGRQLTNHVSIELGIGPICRANWGL